VKPRRDAKPRRDPVGTPETWGVPGDGRAGVVPRVAGPAAGGKGRMERGAGCEESCGSGWAASDPDGE